jgi:elongation factor G
VPLQIPIGSEDGFTGVIDLIAMKAYEYKEGNGETYLTRDLNGQEMAEAYKHREQILEILSENDDELLEKYLEAAPISINEVKSSLRKQTISNHLYLSFVFFI